MATQRCVKLYLFMGNCFQKKIGSQAAAEANAVREDKAFHIIGNFFTSRIICSDVVLSGRHFLESRKRHLRQLKWSRTGCRV